MNATFLGQPSGGAAPGLPSGGTWVTAGEAGARVPFFESLRTCGGGAAVRMRRGGHASKHTREHPAADFAMLPRFCRKASVSLLPRPKLPLSRDLPTGTSHCILIRCALYHDAPGKSAIRPVAAHSRQLEPAAPRPSLPPANPNHRPSVRARRDTCRSPAFFNPGAQALRTIPLDHAEDSYNAGHCGSFIAWQLQPLTSARSEKM